MDDGTPRLLTPREVADYCTLNYRTVLKAIEAGELPASRLRGRLRVSRYDMLAWIDRGTVKRSALEKRTTRGLATPKKFQVGSLKAKYQEAL
jgi:excisionase family DNA binding protein